MASGPSTEPRPSSLSNGRGHVREELGLYVLGKLPRPETVAVQGHLAQCGACVDDLDRVSSAASLLALVTADDLAEPAPGRRTHPPRPSDLPRSPAGSRLRPRALPPKAGRRPGRLARSRRLALVAVVVAVGIASLGTVGLWLGTLRDRVPDDQLLVAEATDQMTGVRLVVELVPRSDVTSVRATVRGLEPGALYQLYGVTRQGRSVRVGEFAGTAKAVSGEVAARATDLVRFSLVRADGVVVVTVPFGRTQPVPDIRPTPAGDSSGTPTPVG